MNGWLRLWVFLSLIWLVVVSVFQFVKTPSVSSFTTQEVIRYMPDPYRGRYLDNLYAEPNRFREFNISGLAESPVEPGQVVYMKIDNETVELQFPILDEAQLVTAFKSLRSEFEHLAGADLAEIEDDISKSNQQLIKARDAYITAKSDLINQRTQTVLDNLKIWAIVGVLPPLLLLILGWGISWVYAGFVRSKRSR